MSIITVNDMKAAFGIDALKVLVGTIESGGKQVLNEARVQVGIDQTESEIESYIGSYVSLDSPKNVVKMYALDMARYHLVTKDTQRTDLIHERYKAALLWLKDVAQGKASAGSSGESVSGSAVVKSPDRVFTNTLMAGY